MTLLTILLSTCLVPLILLGFAIRLVLVARRSRTWPTVKATVVESRITERKKGTFVPKVSYLYTVAGQPYTGHRIWPGWPFTMSEKAASAVAAAYAPGSKPAVAVDPGRPQYSVLRPGVHWSHIAILVGFSIFLVVSLLFLPGLLSPART